MQTTSPEESVLAATIGCLALLFFSMFLVPLRDFLGAANVAIILGNAELAARIAVAASA
jgi:hypothetical protein